MTQDIEFVLQNFRLIQFPFEFYIILRDINVDTSFSGVHGVRLPLI